MFSGSLLILTLLIGPQDSRWADWLHCAKNVQECRETAQAGDAHAQYSLGKVFSFKKAADACQWFLRAADQGHVKAQYEAGSCYLPGEGLGEDHEKAAVWFKRAAEQGDWRSARLLMLMYEVGDRVPKDPVKAAKWRIIAAENGDPNSQFELAVLHDKDLGNHAEAVRWYRKAAEWGMLEAQLNLGIKYGRGEGVERDLVMAYMWLSLAAAHDYREKEVREKAAQARDLVAEHMATEQIAEAQRRIEEWQRKRQEEKNPPETEKPKLDNPSTLLRQQKPWKGVAPEALRLLAQRLDTAENARLFIRLWQREGMDVPDHALTLLSADPSEREALEFALGLMATKATSYANSLGEAGRLSEAREAVKIALLIKPSHYPSYLTMMVIGITADDCAMAIKWAKKIAVVSKADLSESSDYFDLGAVESIEEMKQLAGRVLEVCAR